MPSILEQTLHPTILTLNLVAHCLGKPYSLPILTFASFLVHYQWVLWDLLKGFNDFLIDFVIFFQLMV
jgi:hypothetical protein